MKQLKYIAEIEVALRAKTGVVWLGTREEVRLEASMAPVADDLGYELWTWTCTKGISRVGEEVNSNQQGTQALDAALNSIMRRNERIILLCFDAGAWLNDPIALRTTRDVHRQLQKLPKDKAKQIVIIDQQPPQDSMKWVTYIECPLPNREEMASIVDSFLKWASDKAIKDVKKNGNREALISAMLGLTSEDASNALARSLASTGLFDPTLVANEKARVVKGSGLEWYDPDPRGMEALGGMDELKLWLGRRKKAFGTKAREFGLPAPKGCLMVGIPGTGKSLTCKAVANAWGLPLLRMDVGSLFSKYVGESEGKIRQALQTAETIAPCILWVDEIEKAFGGGSGESDGGTSDRVFGTFLTWMQERKEGVFIVATSNDISKLPPEFLRAGRWDELWFVNMPTEKERVEIASVMKNKFAPCANVSDNMVAKASDNYTGAEIEQAYTDAMYAAFDEEREVITNDVTIALETRVPLAQTMKEKIDNLKKWAEGRARSASAQENGAAKMVGRSIE